MKEKIKNILVSLSFISIATILIYIEIGFKKYTLGSDLLIIVSLFTLLGGFIILFTEIRQIIREILKKSHGKNR